MSNFVFVDSLIPFRNSNLKLENLNLYQFLSLRYGLGSSLVKLICKYSGVSPFCKATVLRRSYVFDKIRRFLVSNKLNLDKNLQESMISRINFYTNIHNYRGIRHSFHYPVRGQRTRTNAKSAKRPSYLKKKL